MAKLGGNWSKFSVLPFDSPQWMQQMPTNLSATGEYCVEKAHNFLDMR
jgi:hypothetical protein